MRTPHQLRVPLRPSRCFAIAIPLLGFAAWGAWLTIDAPWWCDLPVGLALFVWMFDGVRRHGLRSSSTSIVEVLLSGDAVVVMRTRAGKLTAGHVRSASYVHPLITTIVWRPDGAWRSRSLPIVPDMLDIDDFRRLRVLLRYGRREVTAGAPASHA
jgi:hypothetical protein